MDYAKNIGANANGQAKVIVDDHETADIMKLLQSKIGKKSEMDDVRTFVNSLAGDTDEQKCEAIYYMLVDNVKFNPDPSYKQDLKSPARMFADAKKGRGADCKSFSNFIGNCLYVAGIPFCLRFVSFNKHDPTPTHVYVVAMPKGGPKIIMDGVMDKYNAEKPYQFKKDKCYNPPGMSGLGLDERTMRFINKQDRYHDGNIIDGIEDFITGLGATIPGKMGQGGEIGSWFSKQFKSIKKDVSKAEHGLEVDAKAAGQAIKKSLNDVVNVVKKFNPLSELVRNGILLAAKLNFFNIAGRMRLGYLTQAQAQAKGYDLTEWNKLHKIVTDFGNNTFKNILGGDPANLQKAILSGKNKLNGYASIGECGRNMLGQLDPATASALAAASAIIGTLIKILNGVDQKKMVASAVSPGFAEQQAGLPSTLTPNQAQELVDGANSLTAGSGLAPVPDVHPAAFGNVPAPQMDKRKKLLIFGGAAIVIIGGAALLLSSGKK
jgi:hypothetical protein